MNKNYLRKTKIVATLGPSITQKLWSWDMYNDPKNKEKVEKAHELVESALNAGINVIRLNFSHGDAQEHAIRVKLFKETAAKLNKPISVLLDTKGPEIRVWDCPDDGVEFKKGDVVKIYCLDKKLGSKEGISVTDSTGKYDMSKDLKIGSLILIGDGKWQLKVTDIDRKSSVVLATAMNNYKVSTKKRINLPGANYSMEFISEKDRNDIILCAKEKYDYIAISFTNSKKNVLDVRKILNANGGENVKIIAKIESAMGIKNLESIVEAADGIMVARGDLSLEIPFIEVPYYQAKMVDLCRAANKPCIVATQMLDSMEANLIPTRAEVTDVFYATKLSADATMLSGETANGLFPIEAINTMSVIDKEGEYIHCNCKENLKFNELAKENGYDAKQVKLANDLFKNTKPENCATPEAKYPYEIIALYDNDNALLKTLSNARLPVAVVFVTDDVTQYNSYGVYFGVHPFLVKNLNEAKKNYESVNKDIVKAYASGNKKVLTVVNNKIVSGNK